ncbi:MAG: ABC-type transport auxiliary lipoprotein family protein [Myxococcota bacterium]
MRRAFIMLFGLSLGGCLGAVPNLRSYYVLAGDPSSPAAEPAIRGSVRVRNMDADAVYEKFQIVVRRNPYELRYSDLHVWAVKPNQMVSDIIAKTLSDSGTFEDVTRVLGDTKPDFTLGGELNAMEIYDSDDLWYAHLALSLRLTRFDNGEQVWSMTYDQRKLVESKQHAHAVRAMSELLSAAVRQAVVEMTDLKLSAGKSSGSDAALERERAKDRAAEARSKERDKAAQKQEEEPTIYVPERR